MEIEELKSILEVISSIATIIGIPVAIFLYIDGKRKERIERMIHSTSGMPIF